MDLLPKVDGVNIGDVVLVDTEGNEVVDGIYEYGQVVTIIAKDFNNFKLQNISHERLINGQSQTDVLSMGSVEKDGDTNVFIHTSSDGNYVLKETRKIMTNEVDGNVVELNYSTEQIELIFTANDFTANGLSVNADGCSPALGSYTAHFIKQFNLKVEIVTWIDILDKQLSTEIGGEIEAHLKSTNGSILNADGEGLIDAGEIISIKAYPYIGYNFIDYSDGIRADGVDVNILSQNVLETFAIDNDRTIYVNFELKGYTVNIIMGNNGKQVRVYSANDNPEDDIYLENPGKLSVEVKHGYTLKFDVFAKSGYAVASVTAIGKPETTYEVTVTNELAMRAMEYINVVGSFDIEISFRRELWSDHPSDSLTGEGTVDNPYLITNGHDLGLIANMVNINGETFLGKYFKVVPKDEDGNLIDTIDLSAYYFNPIGIIGNDEKQFKGTIEGDFKTIAEIKIDGISSQLGFFNKPNAVINNLTFNNLSIVSTSSDSVVGGIAAINEGTLNNVQIIGTSTITATGTVGGIVGINNGTINRVKSEVAVSGYGKYVGGIVGINSSNISYANNSKEVTNGTTNTETYVGGIAGYTTLNSLITKSGNFATISGNYAGGIVGNFARGTISDVYNVANVVGTTFAGGIFGYKDASSDTQVNISNSYSVGKVGNSTSGGIYGYVDSSLTIQFNNVFYSTANTGNTAQKGASAKSDAELRNIDTFTGFDFVNVWGIDNNTQDIMSRHNYGRPFIWEVETWDDWTQYSQSVTPNEDGSYYIYNPAQLVWLSEKVNSGELITTGINFELKSNIDLFGHNFIPIGTEDNKFEGNFIGNGFSISGLTIDGRYTDKLGNAVGLFGYTNNAKVQDLNMLTTFIVEDSAYAGTLIGNSTDTTITNVIINSEGGKYLGKIKSLPNSNSIIGGLVGYFDGSLQYASINVGVQVEDGIGGGVVGKNTATIDQIASTSTIIANNTNAVIGGIIGDNEGQLTNAYFMGGINTNVNAAAVGGIVGNNTGIVKYTYAVPSAFTATGIVGGIIGINDTYTVEAVTDTDKVTYNYFSNSTGLNETQGIGKAGSTLHNAFNSNFYVDRAEMKTPQELKKEDTFKKWDFDFIWAIDYTETQLNGGYPLFYYNNNYKVIEVTVLHELYEEDQMIYGRVIRRSYDRSGKWSERVIEQNAVTEKVYVLDNNYVGFNVVPYDTGVIETVKVDGIDQVGEGRELIEFTKVVSDHTIEVLFIRRLYEFTINGVIDALDGYMITSDTIITAVLKNTDTGTAYIVTLTNGQSKKLYDIARGHYVLVVNVPMFFEAKTTVTNDENTYGNVVEVDLIPSATDAEVTITLTKVNDRWQNDTTHNFS